MSIFFSPDEPKLIDNHTGRMIRLRPRSQSFSREKDNTILIKKRSFLRNAQVVPECTELRSLREAYDSFIFMFSEFNKQNGPNITGNYMSNNFLHFKAAFEPFLLHASHYFNSSEHCHAVRRYSPLLQFSAKVLREWSNLVSTMNKIASSIVLPHLHVLQNDYEMLNQDVSTLSSLVTSRSYYKDELYSASNYLKHQITSCYQATYDVFAHESDRGIKKSQINALKQQIVLLSRDINVNFLGLLPNSVTSTPEMTRVKTHMKAACGDIVSLIEAGYFFRRRMDKIQNQMSILHVSLCNMLDKVQIKYEIDVEPIGGKNGNDETRSQSQMTQTFSRSQPISRNSKQIENENEIEIEEEEEVDKENNDDNFAYSPENTESFENNGEEINDIVNDIGLMLNINVRNESGTIEKLSTIKKKLERNSSSLSRTTNLSRVSIPPPIRSRGFSKTALPTPRKLK